MDSGQDGRYSKFETSNGKAWEATLYEELSVTAWSATSLKK